MIKHTSGSVAAWLGVDQNPPFQAWLGNCKVINDDVNAVEVGLNVAIKLPI